MNFTISIYLEVSSQNWNLYFVWLLFLIDIAARVIRDVRSSTDISNLVHVRSGLASWQNVIAPALKHLGITVLKSVRGLM